MREPMAERSRAPTGLYGRPPRRTGNDTGKEERFVKRLPQQDLVQSPHPARQNRGPSALEAVATAARSPVARLRAERPPAPTPVLGDGGLGSPGQLSRYRLAAF
jgi:hypothetical protein